VKPTDVRPMREDDCHDSASQKSEQLLELQNAYAAVQDARLQASAGKLTKKLRRK
jgi:hypothetical protein